MKQEEKQKILDEYNDFLERNKDVLDEYYVLVQKRNSIVEEKPKEELYVSTDKYDYYIIYPYEDIGFDGKYKLRKHGFDFRRVNDKHGIWACLSLCNYSKDEIIEKIEEQIREDNA